MTEPAHDILNRALELDIDDRAELAAKLLESLAAEPQDEVDAAWEKEIQRRVARARSGEAKFSDWEDVKKRLEG